MDLPLLLSIVSVLLSLGAVLYFWRLSRVPIFKDKTSASTAFQSIQHHLKQLDNEQTRSQHEIKKLYERLDQVISIVKLVKYTGMPGDVGQNSFSLLLLSKELNGIIITNIYTKDIARFSVKEITAGQAVDNLLPEEEQMLNKVRQDHA